MNCRSLFKKAIGTGEPVPGKEKDMDYEQFINQIAEDLKYSIPGAVVETIDVSKMQGESYRGISIRPQDSPVAASMNLRGAYERLMDGEDYHDILQSFLWKTASGVFMTSGK